MFVKLPRRMWTTSLRTNGLGRSSNLNSAREPSGQLDKGSLIASCRCDLERFLQLIVGLKENSFK